MNPSQTQILTKKPKANVVAQMQNYEAFMPFYAADQINSLQEGGSQAAAIREVKKRTVKRRQSSKKSSDFKNVTRPEQIDDGAIESLQKAIGSSKKKSKLKYTFNIQGTPGIGNTTANFGGAG